MKEKKMNKEKVVIVGVKTPRKEIDTEELKGLIEALGGEVIQIVIQKRKAPSPSTYIGKGKVREIDTQNATLIVAYHTLSYSQKRNLENLTGLPVIDRTEVILEIFARRARTKEAKLQVELAKASYQLSHLRGKGKELSRLGGGIGTRGPGETKTEVEARVLRKKIHKLKKEIEEIEKRYSLVRESRKRKNFITIAVVGYTNVGKSTLVKALTKKDVFIKNIPFATLDVKTGSLYLEDKKVLISDTVGFIRNLPHELIASFKATLGEVKESDILLIVFDVSSKKLEEELKSVKEVLKKLGAWNKPKIFVANKTDCIVDSYEKSQILYTELLGKLPEEDAPTVFISAKFGWGFENLKLEITKFL
ncbi:GTPase HflX [Desulfurobacterium thermolithotrophum]|nr:GTPase HflX [Desulfurobacterium thermolithotrophum]